MLQANELLEHASVLVAASGGKEVDFRRAVSASYYAVFHLISDAVASQVSPPTPSGLRGRCQRVLEHRAMKNAMTSFLTSDGVKRLSNETAISFPFSHDIAEIARTFGELQDARHLADYDVVDSAGIVSLSWALEYLDKAKRIFETWDRAKSTDTAAVFLAAMVFAGRWAK